MQDGTGTSGGQHGKGGQGSVPDSLPPRPGALRVAIAVMGLESVALLAAAVSFVVVAFTGAAVATSLLALAAMFAVMALGLAATTRSLWMLRRWARPAGVAWQVLQALFGFSVVGADLLMGLAAIIPAAVFLAATFTPASIRAFELGQEYYAAHPPEPAPLPKRW